MLNSTDKIIKHKTRLLNLAEELGNVSKACQVMGMSRDTFYRYKAAVDEGKLEALFERTRRRSPRSSLLRASARLPRSRSARLENPKPDRITARLKSCGLSS